MLDQETQEYINWSNKMIANITFFFLVISVPIGLALNLLMMLVFLRNRLKSLTMGLYYIVGVNYIIFFTLVLNKFIFAIPFIK